MIEKIGRTLEELYDTYIKDFSKFLQLTEGLLFGEDCDGQLRMIFIEDVDELSNYFDFIVEHLEEDNSILRIIIKDNK